MWPAKKLSLNAHEITRLKLKIHISLYFSNYKPKTPYNENTSYIPCTLYYTRCP
jgi:hypothetical protein